MSKVKISPRFYRAEDYGDGSEDVAGWVGYVVERRHPVTGRVYVVEEMYPVSDGATCPVIVREA